MKKHFVVPALLVFTALMANAVFAIQPGDLSEAEIKNLVKMSSQLKSQQQMIADLKSKLVSTTSLFAVMLVAGVGIMLFAMKLMGNKHKEHLHQQIHNYHAAHHGDTEFDHSYVHHHHHHHHHEESA